MRSSLFLSHGTPLLLTGDNSYTRWLRNYAAESPVPKAVVVFTSHWERHDQAVSAGQSNQIIYDFAGGPDELYEYTYSPPGDPVLSDRLLTLLAKAGIFAVLDDNRALDHGVWVPLSIMYPEADIPVISLSINPDLSPERQYEIGRSLSPLKNEDVLIIGSGGTTCNTEMINIGLEIAEGWAVRFEEWVEEKVKVWDTEALFLYRDRAPFALSAAPTKEHFIPLFIAMGAGADHKQPQLLHKSFQFGSLSLTAWEFC